MIMHLSMSQTPSPMHLSPHRLTMIRQRDFNFEIWQAMGSMHTMFGMITQAGSSVSQGQLQLLWCVRACVRACICHRVIIEAPLNFVVPSIATNLCVKLAF